MAFIVNDNGDITLIQGDSGHVIITDIDTQKEYLVYLAIQDKKRNIVYETNPPISTKVGDEIKSTVDFFLSGGITNLLTVPKNQETEEYYYAIKLCSSTDNTEDTASLGNNDISIYNTITVYPKRVEGI